VLLSICARICPDDPDGLVAHVKDSAAVPDIGRIFSTIEQMECSLPMGSPQRRVLRALVCSSQTLTQAQTVLTPLSKKAFIRAREDSGFLMLGHEITNPTRTYANYSKKAVEMAVQHILTLSDQQSWGQTRYLLPSLSKVVTSSSGVVLWAPGSPKEVDMPCLRR
jgi:hypothetical protein